jgi:hypothetical protein
VPRQVSSKGSAAGARVTVMASGRHEQVQGPQLLIRLVNRARVPVACTSAPTAPAAAAARTGYGPRNSVPSRRRARQSAGRVGGDVLDDAADVDALGVVEEVQGRFATNGSRQRVGAGRVTCWATSAAADRRCQ